MSKDMCLYDAELLHKLDFEKHADIRLYVKDTFGVDADNQGLRVRPLKESDYDRGFLQLLAQLTQVGEISRQTFQERFNRMRESEAYYTTVIEDVVEQRVVGAATLAIEFKFIHQCATRGLIEDVIVSDAYRGRQLGKLLLATLTDLGQKLGCYKITLNCKDDVVRFYETFGYTRERGNANFLICRTPKQ